jgi:short-subunit dehydrogenase|tara:strand:+ start:428 stop:1159 length:732 start_codon:yes stop_codon:yes gene_type:complete
MQKQIALITGASRGIGKAIAIDFAQNNINVVLTGRNENRLIDINNELKSYNINSYYIPADISNDSGINNIIEFLTKSNLEINILINNAGIIHPRIHLVDFDMEEWVNVINVNLVNAVKLTKSILPHMIRQKYGKIVNISSIGGRKGAAGRTAYRITKAGLISFTESLAAEVKKDGIDVNCICPGSVITEGYVEAFGQQSIENNHMMDPSEIAQLCTFLVGPNSSSVTGAIVDAFGKSNPLFNL